MSTVHVVCKYIEEGIYDKKELCKLADLEFNNKNKDFIRDIQRGRLYKHISKEYDFSEYYEYLENKKHEKNKEYVKKENLAKNISYLISKKFTNSEIIEELCLSNKHKSFIKDIKQKKSFKHISDKYF